MSSFEARLRLPGQTRIPLYVVVDISDERMTFASGEHSLGDWALEEVDVEVRPDGFHLMLDREEVVLQVVDSDRFAGALGIRLPAPAQDVAAANGGADAHNGVSPNGYNGSSAPKGIAGRLDGISPEEQFDEVRRRIRKLEKALTDDSISPPEVFRRWLRLLKELNLRYGQGAMPTPIFHRLNTELLELIPVPPRASRPEPRPVPVV